MSFGRQLLYLILLAGIFFAVTAPLLRWPEFSGDSEDNVVQTVLEMRHGGPWWVPTLGGMPRLRKPPLAAWIAAAAVSPRTVLQLDSIDLAVREQAYRDLAFEVRWPSLAASALMLVGVGVLGRLVAGSAAGFFALLIAGSSLVFLRFSRVAMTDVHLALWVTWANVGLATVVLGRRPWLGFSIAGVALGLGLLSKDPVAPLQTVLPVIVYGVLTRRRISVRQYIWPAFVGLLICLAIALPWWIDAYLRHPELSMDMRKELGGEGRLGISHDPVLAYIYLLPLQMFPWVALLIAGIFISVRDCADNRGMLLMLCLVLVPLVVMTLHRDRKDRYTLPMTAPAAVLCAAAALEIMRHPRPQSIGEQIVRSAHWCCIIVFLVGLPIAGYLKFKTIDGAPWCSPQLTMALLIGGAALLGLGGGLCRHYPGMLVVTSAVAMLWVFVPLIRSLSCSPEGMSEMKPIADRLRAFSPTGKIIYYEPPEDKVGKPITVDLDIYLDRIVPAVHAVPRLPTDVAAMVVLQRDKQSAPSFAGWHELFDLITCKPQHRYHYHVFVPN